MEEYDVKVPDYVENYIINWVLYDAGGTKHRMPILFGTAAKRTGHYRTLM